MLVAGKVSAQTFNPTKVPIITEEKELQLRVLEGHSRRLAEIEQQIRILKGSPPSYNPYVAPKSSVPKTSSPPSPDNWVRTTSYESPGFYPPPMFLPVYAPSYGSPFGPPGLTPEERDLVEEISNGPISRQIRPGQSLHIFLLPGGGARVLVK